MFKKKEMGKGGRVLMKTHFRAALSKALSSTTGEWNLHIFEFCPSGQC